jgi:hypothetical protein
MQFCIGDGIDHHRFQVIAFKGWVFIRRDRPDRLQKLTSSARWYSVQKRKRVPAGSEHEGDLRRLALA